MNVWDATRVKSHLRLTAQRLGQMQNKIDSQGQITRIDISTLLQQGNVALARAKAQTYIREDILGDLLQVLEMHIGVVIEHFGELERSEPPDPLMTEAASSIIFAAPHIESKELLLVRDILIQHLGPDFARSAANNHDNYVSPRVLRALSTRPPSAAQLDQFLYGIARTRGVQWVPDLPPYEKVNALSEILDPLTKPEIDMSRLRMLCSHGLPEYPSWLRPRIWRLLLGTLPPLKSAWDDEARKQRDNYYDLVRRLLEPFDALPPPTSPLVPSDASLVDTSNELTHVPPGLLSTLEKKPEESGLCPLDQTAPQETKLQCAWNLDIRLRQIREMEAKDNANHDATPEIRLDSTPEIRLESLSDISVENMPEIRLESPPIVDVDDDHNQDASLSPGTPEVSLTVPGSPSSANSSMSTTLVPSRPYNAMNAHSKHASALLRLLYIHSSLNPANRSPQIASLLVPVYCALQEEVDAKDSAHVEADTFWLFEAIVSEFGELEEEDGANVWMRKFGERLKWADAELADDLRTKGLDPQLPHYSYRWLTTLLTHTLPLQSVLMVWDALFSRPARGRDANPKLDYLLNICASLLICSKNTLARLGKRGGTARHLWIEGDKVSSSPLDARELDDAFLEGMTFLQNYSIETVGGIDRILQAAFDLAERKETEESYARGSNTGFGARLRDTVWKGFATQAPALAPHPEEAEESADDSSDDSQESSQPSTGQPISSGPTLTSRFANTVWKGITNQSAMEVPSSPISPYPPPKPLPDVSSPILRPSSIEPAADPQRQSSIWGYAGKLRESDAAAKLAKASTNWKVKAMDVWSKRASLAPSLSPMAATFSARQETTRPISLGVPPTTKSATDTRRGSLPVTDRSDRYSPPARPAYFRPPRDSMMPAPRGGSLYLDNRLSSPLSDDSRASSPGSATRSGGPKPLLLNSASLTAARGLGSAPAADREWADLVRSQRPADLHQRSESSVSSPLQNSASDARHRADTRSSWDTDHAESRFVPLHRKNPSPMARNTRREQSVSASSAYSSTPSANRRESAMSSGHGSDGSQGWARRDSLNTQPSPPPPETPMTSATFVDEEVRVKAPESQRGSLALSEGIVSSDAPEPGIKARRGANLRLQVDEGSDASITQAPMRSGRVKSKRYAPRSANARTAGRSLTDFPHPERNSLVVDSSDDLDNVVTPRAMSFDVSAVPPSPSSRSPRRLRKLSGEKAGEPRTRKVSSEGREARVRKISSDGSTRVRKTSTDGREKHKRESAAVEGDDEGYDDLLSAYESEDSIRR